MRIAFASALAVLMAACGVDVLKDCGQGQLGCPDLVRPELVAVITQVNTPIYVKGSAVEPAVAEGWEMW